MISLQFSLYLEVSIDCVCWLDSTAASAESTHVHSIFTMFRVLHPKLTPSFWATYYHHKTQVFFWQAYFLKI